MVAVVCPLERSSSVNMIPIAKPWMGEEEREAVQRPLITGWVTQGPEVEAFEREFAAFVGAGHACAVANCTAALHLALEAAGVGPGDEVVTVSHSFIATANAVRYTGAMPVFVDIEAPTFNMDASRVAAALSDRTRAILVAHQIGMPADLGALVELATQHGIVVVEDAACAIGSEVRWKERWERIGAPHGVMACFSFHPRKLLTTGDGGMITTHDARLDGHVRLARQHAMSASDTRRHAATGVVLPSFDTLGYNYRMTDMQAAVGRVQLGRVPEMIARRRLLAARYDAALRGLDGVKTPVEPAWARTNYQSYCVWLPDDIDQITLMAFMRDQGVATRTGVMNAHQEGAYPQGTWRCGVADCDASCDAHTCARLPVSEAAFNRTLMLPLYHELEEEEVDTVVAAFVAGLAAQRA